MGLTVNERAYAWADTEFSYIAGDGAAKVFSRGFTAFNWGHRTIITNQYGTGRTPFAQVVGTYQVDATTMSMFKRDWNALRESIGEGWQGTAFAIVAKYRNPGEAIITTKIEGRLQGEVESLAQGDDAIMQDIEIVPNLITTNDQVAYQTEGGQ